LGTILNRRQKILTAVKKFNEKLKFPYLLKKIWQFHTYSMISSDHFQFHTISMISMISSKRGNPEAEQKWGWPAGTSITTELSNPPY
jgi:hypothetical protein